MYSPYDIGTYNHQACSSRTPPRDIDLQRCLVRLVEDTACPQSPSYHPSKSFSCMTDQRFSQPHRCLPQWFASNQSVGCRLGNHNVPRCVYIEGRLCQVRSTSSFPQVLHDPRSIHYIQERFLLRYHPLAASVVFAFLALPPRAVAYQSQSP